MEESKAKTFAEKLHNQGDKIFQFQETFVYYILAKRLEPFKRNKLFFLYGGVGAFICWDVMNMIFDATSLK